VIALALCGKGRSCCFWAFYRCLLRGVVAKHYMVQSTSTEVRIKTPRLLPPFQPASTSIPQYSQYWLPSLPCPFKFSRWDCLTTEYRVTTEHLLSFVPECPSSVVMDGRFTATGSGSGYRHCLRLETGGALADLESMQAPKSKPYSILAPSMGAADLRLASCIAFRSVRRLKLTILSFSS
jgi:hypothetical protein